MDTYIPFILIAIFVMLPSLIVLNWFMHGRKSHYKRLKDAQLYEILKKSKFPMVLEMVKNEIRSRNLQLPPEPVQYFLPKNTTIQNITLRIASTDEIKWPPRCPCCGNALNEQDTIKHDIKVEQLFAFSPLKNISLGFCDKCYKECSKPMQRAIEVLIVLGIGYTLYAGESLMPKYQLSVLYIFGKIIGVWLSLAVFLIWGASDKKRSLLALRIKKIRGGFFSVIIKNESYAKYFIDENATIAVDKEANKSSKA